MLDRLDHIIKNALKEYEVVRRPDWDVFYDLWQAEHLSSFGEDEGAEWFDESVSEAVGDLEYSAVAPDWDAFAIEMDAAEAVAASEADEAFDTEVKTVLTENDDFPLNQEHWMMFSQRLDHLNNRPRIILMKVVEAVAVIFILFHLSNFYSEYQRFDNSGEALISYFDRILGKEDESEVKVTIPPNDLMLDADSEVNAGISGSDGLDQEEAGRTGADNLTGMTGTQKGRSDHESDALGVSGIAPGGRTQKSEDYLPPLPSLPLNPSLGLSGKTNGVEKRGENQSVRTIDRPDVFIDYSAEYLDKPRTLDRIALQDISLLRYPASDSLLSMVPTFQVVKPRLHSALEAGILADATTVEIQDAYPFASIQPLNEITLNPGLFLRYKIMYKNLYGSIGADYMEMKYSGLNHPNEVSLLSLPFELGYNIVNLPSFRLYLGGGFAGRFVPVARYSSESFNLASDYNQLESNEKTNGLLRNGPFEINSYLSGRFSVGIDTHVSRNFSIGLRYTHDVWLKGIGIGFNYDRFRSSHLALGTSYHF